MSETRGGSQSSIPIRTGVVHSPVLHSLRSGHSYRAPNMRKPNPLHFENQSSVDDLSINNTNNNLNNIGPLNETARESNQQQNS